MPKDFELDVRGMGADVNAHDAFTGTIGSRVTLYRAVPLDVNGVRPGSYATLSKKYAESHLEAHQTGRYVENADLVDGGHIVSVEVPRNEVVLLANNEVAWVPKDPYLETMRQIQAGAAPVAVTEPAVEGFKHADKLKDWVEARGIKDSATFAARDLGGTGAKSTASVLSHIDTNTMGRIDLARIRSELSKTGNWHYLHKVSVKSVDTKTSGGVEPSGKEKLSVPIVINAKGVVVDGRHRVELARKRGIEELPAYMPASRYYEGSFGGKGLELEPVPATEDLLAKEGRYWYEDGDTTNPVVHPVTIKGQKRWVTWLEDDTLGKMWYEFTPETSAAAGFNIFDNMGRAPNAYTKKDLIELLQKEAAPEKIAEPLEKASKNFEMIVVRQAMENIAELIVNEASRIAKLDI
jgi:hypothetical protein